MREHDTSRAAWRKSSYSNGSGGDCVEVAASPPLVSVRDSHDRHGPKLVFTPTAWQAFLGQLRNCHTGHR
jgi:uncharacterized protein DUF397